MNSTPEAYHKEMERLNELHQYFLKEGNEYHASVVDWQKSL